MRIMLTKHLVHSAGFCKSIFFGRIIVHSNAFSNQKNEKNYQCNDKEGGVKPFLAMLLATSLGMPGQGQAQTANRVVPTGSPSAAPAATDRLWFCGQAPGTGFSPVRNQTLALCPNVVNVAANTVASQPYIFEIRSTCRGNVYNVGRPPYIYTIAYRTALGREYKEQWKDETYYVGDSRVQFFLFDRVPNYNGPGSISGLNNAASTGSGVALFSRYLDPNGVFQQTAAPGELITSVRLEGSGYNCGTFGGDDSGVFDINYYTLPPAAIAVAPAAGTLCRSQLYTLTTAGALGASGYTWTATNGAQVINGTGFNNQVTLNLTNVPPTAADVTVSVQATNAPGTCGGPTSSATTLVLPMSAASPQPESMKLNGGTCPSATIDKTVSVSFVNQDVKYRWKLLGAVPSGTFLTSLSGAQGQITGVVEVNSILLRTPTACTVTVSAEAIYDGCSGISTPLVQTFQISAPVPQLPRAIGPATWCIDLSNRIRMAGTTGVTYSLPNFPGFNPVSNILPAGASVTSVTQPSVGSQFFDVQLGANAAGNYPVSFNLYVVANSPCTGVATQYFTVPVNSSVQQQCIMIAPGGNRLAPPVSLYPNPTTGQVQLAPQGATRYAWAKVMDTQGQTVLQQADDSAAGLTQLDLKALPIGLYQVQLFDGKQLPSKRLVKE